jgi:hypothetical protein
MKKAFAILLVFSSVYLFGQKDTLIYYTSKNKVISSQENAIMYDKVVKKNNSEYLITTFLKVEDKWNKIDAVKIKIESDSTLSEKTKEYNITRVFHKTDSGCYYVKDYSNKILISEGKSSLMFPLIKQGNWKIFDETNGKLKSEDVYLNNQLISNKFWLTESYYINDVFTHGDKDPEYEGGPTALFKYISSNLVYPQYAMENNISRNVKIRIIIMKDGSIGGTEIVKKADPLLDLAAINVINSIPNKWKPGQIDGKEVNMSIIFPINFNIEIH